MDKNKEIFNKFIKKNPKIIINIISMFFIQNIFIVKKKPKNNMFL